MLLGYHWSASTIRVPYQLGLVPYLVQQAGHSGVGQRPGLQPSFDHARHVQGLDTHGVVLADQGKADVVVGVVAQAPLPGGGSGRCAVGLPTSPGCPASGAPAPSASDPVCATRCRRPWGWDIPSSLSLSVPAGNLHQDWGVLRRCPRQVGLMPRSTPPTDWVSRWGGAMGGFQ